MVRFQKEMCRAQHGVPDKQEALALLFPGWQWLVLEFWELESCQQSGPTPTPTPSVRNS